MAWETPGLILSLDANADLSAWQYCFIKLVSGKWGLVTATTDDAFAILQNKPDLVTNVAGAGMVDGVSKCRAGAAFSAGPVKIDANGRIIAASSTNNAVGFALQAASALGDLVPCFISKHIVP